MYASSTLFAAAHSPTRLVLLRGQVWGEVVEHEPDPNLWWIQAADVTQEPQERGAVLGGHDVAVEPITAQVVGAHHVAHTVRPVVGRPPAATPRLIDIAWPGRDRCPLAAGMRLQVQWPELVDADDHRRIIIARLHMAIRDRVELEDPVLLRFEVRIVGLFERLDHLKRHALLTEQNPKALMADVVDHPLSDQELSQLAE